MTLIRRRSSQFLLSWGIFFFACTIQGRAADTVASPVPIDFSYAGYEAGKPIPWVRSVLTVKPSGGDDTTLLQGALDRIAKLAPSQNGFRGALLLAPGRFHVAGQLHLRVDGVVLRGSGSGAGRTEIVADGVDRRPLIVVGAEQDVLLGPAVQVIEDVPAGASELHLTSVADLKTGDHVVVRRPSTSEWISAMSMSGLPGTFATQRLDWKPGSHDLVWDRIITAIHANSNTVEIDAPITTAIEKRYGGGTLAGVIWNVPAARIGIEDLKLTSVYDAARAKDEDHSWIAVLLDHVEDAWVRNVAARHFVASAVRVNLRGRRITVANCSYDEPVSEEGGYRRQAFLLYGQQVLVYHCQSEKGMNDFASGMLAGGPNVFLDCVAKGSLEASGAFEGWSSGVLYENVRVPDARIQMILDFSRAQGAGWTAANSLIWNSKAQGLDAIGPPGAPNFVVNSPAPLYESELAQRTGVRHAGAEEPSTQDSASLPEFKVSDLTVEPEPKPGFHPVDIINGHFVVDGKTAWGPSQAEAWWRGDTSIYTALASTGSSVTRFTPGVIAPGETEDLKKMIDRLVERGVVSMQVIPGLWYDHRRDAHTIERRTDGDVWAPFYEAPWARSGKGKAWDGLSKFDLTRYNPWYFERERQFAFEASKAGVLVVYDLYNTHNVLEIGPHWIDYAWRPANNINDTGLPEPPPLKPHNRNDVGNEFYSKTYAPLRALHRAYILHTLDQLGDLPNVIFCVAYQYAGPLEFEQFFQDTVHEWEVKHGRKIRIALITSKQTTDAILGDPERSKQVAVVDMRYWEYRPDGTLFAPEAGKNHAFRELISEAFPGYTDTPPSTTPQMVYREVREYRDRYPNIALLPMEEGAGPIPILMGGAASESALRGRPPGPVPTAEQAASAMYPLRPASPALSPDANADRAITQFVRTYLSQSLVNMAPKDGWVAKPEETWVLAGEMTDPVLIYSLSGDEVTFKSPLPARLYSALWFDPRTMTSRNAGDLDGKAQSVLKKPDARDWLLLLQPTSQ